MKTTTFKIAKQEEGFVVFPTEHADKHEGLTMWDYDLSIDLNSPKGIIVDSTTGKPRNRTDEEYGFILLQEGKIKLARSIRSQIGELVGFLTAEVTTQQLIHWQGKADRARAMRSAVKNGHEPDAEDMQVVMAELTERGIEGETWQKLTTAHIAKNAALSTIVSKVEGHAKPYLDRLETMTTPEELGALVEEVEAYAKALRIQLNPQG